MKVDWWLCLWLGYIFDPRSVAHHVSCMHQTLEGFDTISKGEDFEQNDINFLRS